MKRTALPMRLLYVGVSLLGGLALLGGCAPAVAPQVPVTVGLLPTSTATPFRPHTATPPSLVAAGMPSATPLPPSPTARPRLALATSTPLPPPSPTPRPHATATLPLSPSPRPSPPPPPLVHTPLPPPSSRSETAHPAQSALSRGRGAYVTGSSDPDEAEIAWLSRFAIVHAGGLLDPLPSDVIARLRNAGVHTLLVYDWLPATYHYTDGESDDPLTQWLYDNRDWASLNPDGPFPHCTEEGYDWCEDYYFDLGDETVRQERVDYLVQTVRDLGYDGVFFDWSNSQFLDEDAFASIREEYESRHPDLPYAEAIGLFYQALREAGLVVQSNQGFRDAEAILPSVNYDMTESYGTTDETFGAKLRIVGQGEQEVPQTVYYPVSDNPRHGSLRDTLDVIDWLESLRVYTGQGYGGVVYMNYAAPEWQPTANPHVFRPVTPRNAIYYGYALAQLVGEIGYTEVPWDHTLERSEVYFYGLGQPVHATYQALPRGGYVRYYTHGLALVGEWQHPTTLVLRDASIPAQGWAYDPYTQTWLPIREHTIRLTVKPEPDPLTNRMAPLGRIIVYIATPG